jgi:hypothetical protein
VIEGCTPLPDGVDDVSAAVRKAVQIGKPLLVIVIPDDDGQKYERGELWGEVLNHGSTSTWAALACVEVVCAKAAALQAVVPGVVVGDGLFVLVETDAMPATASVHDAKVPAYDDKWGRGGGGVDWKTQQDNEKKIGERRIAILGKLIESAVFGVAAAGGVDRPLLERRVEQTRKALNGAKGSAETASSVAVWSGDLESPAAAATARLKVARVRGSKWAVGGGCGVSVEGENDDVGIACGMGHTPALSRRFLYWFTK